MNTAKLGYRRWLLPIPGMIWQRQIRQGGARARQSLGFMSADHHRVRDYVVLELPKLGQPISPAVIAGSLDLPLARVQAILDELEARLTFLYRDEEGAVTWAYPVTADPTPHRVFFSSGEQCYAA